MQKFIVAISECQFRNTTLTYILSQIFKDGNILSFSSPVQMNRWSDQAGDDIALSVYIILPDEADAVCNSRTWLDWLVSPVCIAGNKKVSQVTVLYESETLTDLLSCACEYFGYRMVGISKLECNMVMRKIDSHHEGKRRPGKKDILLTEREMKVLGYLLRGWSLREISLVLNIAMKTIYSFSNSVRKKLGLGKVGLIYAHSEAIRESVRIGLIRQATTGG